MLPAPGLTGHACSPADGRVPLPRASAATSRCAARGETPARGRLFRACHAEDHCRLGRCWADPEYAGRPARWTRWLLSKFAIVEAPAVFGSGRRAVCRISSRRATQLTPVTCAGLRL